MKWFWPFLLMLLVVRCHTPSKPTAPQATVQKTTRMDTTDNRYTWLKERLDSGIDFMASGQEPFWSLEISFDKQMHFKTANGFEITTPVPQGVKAADANVTRYRAQTEQGELIVQLAQQECTNSMSGQKSAYTVTVDVKNNSDKQYTTYKGCGTYTVDYRINDIWVLERINNTALNAADFSKGLPQIEFNLAQKKVFGHTGCNNFNGALEIQGRKIAFGMLLTTRMACPNMDFETNYVNSFQRRTVPYKIENGKLQLQLSTDSVFTYRKID